MPDTEIHRLVLLPPFLPNFYIPPPAFSKILISIFLV